MEHLDPPRLRKMVDDLRERSLEARSDLIANTAIETGGSYFPPSGPVGDHLFVIELFGVSGSGLSEEEAIRSWTKAAEASLAGMEA